MWCSIKQVTKLAVAKVSYPSRIPAIIFTNSVPVATPMGRFRTGMNVPCDIHNFATFSSLMTKKHKRTGRVSFRGAEVSCPNIFFPLLARKSSGFARILPDCSPENSYLKNSRGGGAVRSPPEPHGPYAMLKRNEVMFCCYTTMRREGKAILSWSD